MRTEQYPHHHCLSRGSSNLSCLLDVESGSASLCSASCAVRKHQIVLRPVVKVAVRSASIKAGRVAQLGSLAFAGNVLHTGIGMKGTEQTEQKAFAVRS